MKRIFTGFGFGPIQAGLFVREVARSGNFDRIVIGEIDQVLIDTIRSHKGNYQINIAEKDGIRTEVLEGVEMYNPTVPSDREKLIASVSLSTEIATCLPSVSKYKMGGVSSPLAILEAGLQKQTAPGTLIYTAENDKRAAEILSASMQRVVKADPPNVQFLNTVIGKMSRLVSGPDEIKDLGLATITPEFSRAFLVESFNNILVSRSKLRDLTPGIPSFIEKDELLPFLEAKLYGHIAIHALLAYLGKYKGYQSMAEVGKNRALMKIARDAFIYESGAALCQKYASGNVPLFTPEGFASYAMDLLERMGNPFLGDTVERAGRDIFRKLGPEDRLFGTINFAARYGIKAPNLALGTMAAMATLLEPDDQNKLPEQLAGIHLKDVDMDYLGKLVSWLWRDTGQIPTAELLGQVLQAKEQLIQW